MDEDKQLKQVIKLMKQKYNKAIVDYNVLDDIATDNDVQLLDKNDKILKTISSDELTNLWNIVEGWTVNRISRIRK